MSCEANERLLQTLKTRLAGATDAMIELEMFNTIDEFLRRTSAWHWESDITLNQEQTDYPLPVPADSVFVRMISVSHNNAPVPTSGSVATINSQGIITSDEVFADSDSRFSADELGADLPSGVFSYALYRPNYVSISQPPQDVAAHPLKMQMALSIARSCLEEDCGGWAIEEWMWDMYFVEWLDGVLGRMYSLPAKPWSNPGLATYHSKRFRNGMAFRKQEAARGFVYAMPLWRFPRGGF